MLNGDTPSEESWVKLSDGSILTYSIQGSQPQRGQRLVLDPNNNHANDQWYDAGAVPVRLDSNGGNNGIVPENGPAVRLSDGRILYTGASGHTAIYTPPTTLTGTGSWAAGPDMKNSSNQLVGAFDAPAAVEINGKVLVVTSPIDGNNFPGPATIQEYNPATNTMTIVPNTNGPNLGDPAFIFRMLALPNGQILVSDATNGLKLYSPDSGQVAGVAPNITDIKNTDSNNFTLQGTQLNGFSEGAAYGDDAQMASNFPIVTLFDPSGHVFYARTSNWSNVGVGTGSTPETVNFTLPAGLAAGEYGLQVSASGVKSKAVLLIVGGSGNDTVTINAIGNETSTVVLNGTSLPNPSNWQGGIYVAMEGGTNTINIQGSFADTPIVITGGGSDTVNLGNSAGSAQNLLGSIRIDNVPSFNILNINNSADTTGRNVTLDTYNAYDGQWGSIVGLTPGGVYYKYTDTHTITITNGSGNDVTTLNATDSIAPVTVDGYKGNDIVYAGAGGVLSGITSPVTVKHTGGSGTSWISISDYNDASARTVSVTASTIGAAGLPTFNYTPGQVSVIGFVADGLGNTFNVTGIGAGTLFNLSTGTGNDTVNVQALQGSLAIYGQNGADTVNIGSLAPALGGNVSAIGGSVSVANSSGSTTLVVDDSGDTTARSAVITNSSISGLAPGTINYANLSSLTVRTGVGGGNSTNIQSTSVTTNIIGKSSGGGPDDSAVVGVGGSTQGIAAPLNFSNPPGFTLITIDDSTDATARTVVVANNSVSGISPAVISWVTNDTHAVTVYGGTGGDTFTVTGTNRSTTLNTGAGNDTVNVLATQGTLTIQGQNGADTVTIGSAAPALGGTVAAITGTVSVANAAGSTALVVDDDADTTVRNVVVTSSAITGLAPATISYGSTLSSLTIRTGQVGGNSINVQSTSATTNIIGKAPLVGPDDVVLVGVGGNTQGIAGPLNFSNPTGFDAITIDDSTDATGRTIGLTASSASGIAPALITWAITDTRSVTLFGGTGGNTFNVANTTRLTTLYTGAGNDTVNVQATGAQLSIQGQGGNNTVNVGSLAPTLGGTVAGINGFLSIDPAVGGLTALTIDDSGDTTPRNFTVTNNSTTGLAPVAINYGNLSSLTILTGVSGGNTINVTSTNVTTNIIGKSPLGGPNDTALVGLAGSLSGIAGPLNFSNPPGFTAITIDGSADAAPHTVSLSASTLSGMSPAPISFNPLDTASVNIKGGAGGNTYTVTGTPPNTTLNTGTGADKVNIQGTLGALNVQGQSGADVIVIGSIAPAIGGTVAGILGTVTLANAGGNIALTVDDSADTTARSSIITNSSITGLAPASINFANLLSLTVRTGSGGGNATNVQSNSVTTNIIGNSPVAGPDDSVLVGTGGNLSGILAALNISNSPGFTAVTIDDSTDTTARTALVYSGYVSGLTPKLISWAAANTRSVLINSGFAGNTFNIQSTQAPLTINAGTGSDAYNIGNTSNTLNGIVGNVLINGGAGTYVLGLIDLGSGTSNSYVLGATSITRNGIGVITYFGATNVHMLGGRGNDSYTLNATPAANMFLLDFGGTNKVVGPNIPSTFSIVSPNTVQVGTLYASNIQTLVGGTSNNYFRFLPGGSLTGVIIGGVGGFNTIDESFVSTPVNLNLTTNRVTSVSGPISNIQYVIGNSSVVPGGILTGPAAATNYQITGFNSGLAGVVNFSNFANIVAGAGNDVFAFNTAGLLTGSIDGKAGTNTIDHTLDTNAVTLNLAASTIPGIGGTYANITNFIGGSGNNTLIGTNAASIYSITGVNAGNVSGVTFNNFSNLVAGSSNDSFKFALAGSLTGSIDGGGGANTIDQSLYTTPINLNLATSTISGIGGTFANIGGFSGGTGSNTLTGPNAGTVYAITGNRAGTVGTTTFAGYGSLVGGGGNDVFKFSGTGFLSGSLNGGGGTDTLDYSALSTPTKVNLATSTASAIAGTYSNLQVFVGSVNSTNFINGPVAGSTYNITALDTYNINGLSFSGFGTINAGVGEDNFVVSDGAGLSGKLNGGTGANWLDYSAYTTGVTVNLLTGAATGFLGGCSNIRNVRGGLGNDSLTGNGSLNILIGGAGNDTLVAGNGRSILIGGTGVDTLTGGSADDLLIGGSTTLDNNNAAFDAILAEWQSTTDNYATRINFIKNGGGLNGTNVLNLGTTVIDDLAANVLTGAGGSDWFFKGTNDTLTDRGPTEQVN